MKRAAAAMGLVAAAVLAAWLMFSGTPSGPDVPEHRRQKVAVEELEEAPQPLGRVTRSNPKTAPSSDAVDRGTPEAVPIPGDQDANAPVDNVEITVWPANVKGIQGAIKEVGPAIKRCYDEALKEVPDLDGKFVVGFEIDTVDGMGKVVQSVPVEDRLHDGPTSDCIQNAVEALQFDPPVDGPVNVSWPFVFRNRKP